MAASRPRALTELDDDGLAAAVCDAGGKPFQARQLAHWLYRHAAVDWTGFRNLPRRLLDALAGRFAPASTRVCQVERSDDGTEKLLLELHDGERIECVLIPEGERTTLCVSTQAGCPVGCVFCASGLDGVRRNLTAGEIVEQVLHASRRLGDRRLTNLVVMGMGEPMLNLAGLVPALHRIGDAGGIGLGARRITVSTSGYPDRVDQLAAEDVPWGLAVSLHAADDGLRRRLVPRSAGTVADLVAMARRWQAARGREVTFEVVLLRGGNDTDADADRMARLLAELPCTVNLIPWNPVAEIADLMRPEPERVDAFADRLRRAGLKVTVRRQRGADRAAACGQLRLRATHGAGS